MKLDNRKIRNIVKENDFFIGWKFKWDLGLTIATKLGMKIVYDCVSFVYIKIEQKSKYAICVLANVSLSVRLKKKSVTFWVTDFNGQTLKP